MLIQTPGTFNVGLVIVLSTPPAVASMATRPCNRGVSRLNQGCKRRVFIVVN